MNIYVAGSSQELDRVEAVMAAVRAHGHTIAFDWTVDVRQHAAANKVDVDLTDAQAQSYALFDANAVQDSSVFLLCAPLTVTKGAWFELGYAYAQIGRGFRHAPRVLVSGAAARSCIFTRLPGIELFATDLDALAALGVTP